MCNEPSTDDARRWVAAYRGRIPRRPPIDPHGYYHIGSRGSYGQPLFRTDEEHELFLRLYARTADKYAWSTLTWVLMGNHHHFVLRLSEGHLSEGMRELHGTFSRRIHAIYGMTGQGHLVRHAFFARRLRTDGAVVVACRYVDLNFAAASGKAPEETRWGGYRATVGLDHPRDFHNPTDVLQLISRSATAARKSYQHFVHEGLVEMSRVPSPNDGFPPVVESRS